ncbi:hypothetical protein ACNH6C_09855 [Bdellovibrio bacteriovorus]|uniref:hypothetical protein n=1 Tax=Bdellovibrio bacteriovorus TaxID=959 RepID=UPI003A813425
MRLLIYVSGGLVTILFLYFAVKFAIKTNFSFNGSEKLIPVIGALCFGLYFLISNEVTAKEETKNFNEYSSITFKNDNSTVIPPLFLDQSDPNVSSLRFYFSLPINTMNVPLIYSSSLTPTQILDVFEYCFLERVPFSLAEGETTKKISIFDLAKTNSKNEYLNFPLHSLLELQNKKVDGPRTNISFLDQLKEQYIFLPKEASLTYSYQPETRIYNITHPQFTIKVSIVDGGVLNIRPDINRFHHWLVSKLDAPSGSYNVRKIMIFVSITKSKYFQFLDQKSEYEKLFKSIQENLKRDYSWNEAEKVLKEKYLTSIAEETLDRSRMGSR